MTQEDLDALPTIAIDVALWSPENEASDVYDSDGIRYRVGWYNGVKYKRLWSNQ